jgi:hypothetical protein
VKLADGQEAKTDGLLFRFFKKLYAPFILQEWVRPIVVGTPCCLLHLWPRCSRRYRSA